MIRSHQPVHAVPAVLTTNAIPPPASRLAGGARLVAGVLAVLGGLLAGFGWLDLLRDLGALGAGPAVPDALPLRALANAASQPLARVSAAWLSAGLAAGLALSWTPRGWRLIVVGLCSLVLLAVASDAARAVEETQNFLATVGHRAPGVGPVIEAALFSLGCALPPQRRRPLRPQGAWLMRSA